MLHNVDTDPVLNGIAVSNLNIPPLSCFNSILKLKPTPDLVVYLWVLVGALAYRVEDVSIQGCAVLPKGLHAQSFFMTPRHAGPSHILEQMALGGVRGLVCVRHIPSPVNHGVRNTCPDWVRTVQILIKTY